MKDPILKGCVDDFSENFELQELDESIIFEHFTNYCVVSKQYPREFDFETIRVGGGGDIGVDGAAIIVNGNIVNSSEEINYLKNKNGYLNVSFLFIQTKRSAKFKGDQVGNLIFGIKNFFDENPSIPENVSITYLRVLKDEIYRNSMSLDEPPSLDFFFVTSGEWKEPEPIVGRVKRELQDFEKSKLFSAIEFHFFDAEKLKKAYREIRRKTVKEISFPNHVALPEIQGVRQAFIGSIPAKQYVELISDDDGNLQKYLFDDNVRDFQGSNKVNREIDKTLKSPQEQGALSVFNNGITIIAKKVDPIGTKIKLTDFQIVNGCQTSHVLFANKANILSDTHIAVKIIETIDYDFATKVVKATNRQTEVTDEAFESLRPFHRDLEEFYKAKAKTNKEPIFYERRSKQYDFIPGIKPRQVVSLPLQINAYVSGKLSQPQSTHRYYGELLESNRSRMFREGDSLEPYYICALLLKRVETSFHKKVLQMRLRQFKYHIVFLAYQFFQQRMDYTKKFGYEDIIAELDDSCSYERVFKASSISIDKCQKKSTVPKSEISRSKVFTDQLLEELNRQLAQIKNVNNCT